MIFCFSAGFERLSQAAQYAARMIATIVSLQQPERGQAAHVLDARWTGLRLSLARIHRRLGPQQKEGCLLTAPMDPEQGTAGR
jgi:hypothetical protein